ncbi:hypothetical protein EMCRGX_G001615 [Ephydatia muelleri]
MSLNPDPDVHQIMQIVQSSLSREQELETKLALMQEALNAARSLATESMISIVKEDELISRLEMLENQLQVYSQNSQEDDLKKQLTAALEDKQKSQNSAKESLRSILQEKLECVSKISQLQRDYDKAELECQQYKTLYDVVKQENTHELTKIREQLKNMEKEKKTLEDKLSEEKATLTAAAETLKADVDFTKQQLHSVRARLDQTQDELFRYKVIVETEKQRKALQAAAEIAPSSDMGPALNGHAQMVSEQKVNHSPTSKEEPPHVGEEGRDGVEPPAIQERTSPAALAMELTQSEENPTQQQPEQSLVLGTLVDVTVASNNYFLHNKLAASEGLVEQLRSSVQQYEQDIQRLNAQLLEERSREHQLQLSLSVVGVQLNGCFSQIEMQSTEIVRLRECVRPSPPEEVGSQSQYRQVSITEEAKSSDLSSLKTKLLEKEARERHLEDQLIRCKEEFARLQEDSHRVQRQLVSVQEESTAQLRVSQDEAESIKKCLQEAQEDCKQYQNKCADLNQQLTLAQNFHPFVHHGHNDQHTQLMNTVALVAVGVALAAMLASRDTEVGPSLDATKERPQTLHLSLSLRVAKRHKLFINKTPALISGENKGLVPSQRPLKYKPHLSHQNYENGLCRANAKPSRLNLAWIDSAPCSPGRLKPTWRMRCAQSLDVRLLQKIHSKRVYLSMN